ncbi:hypothetical protein LNO09_22440 [Klebsiella variicola]|nr:hypothetical protein [Klebsiella variicola]
MQYHRIPHSSLEISTLGLGTMTFGEQKPAKLMPISSSTMRSPTASI